MWTGTVVSIHLAKADSAPVETVPEAHAVAGRGLEGDRYYTGLGFYSKKPGTGRQVTLIEAEAVAAVERELGATVGGAATRRNIVTAGVPLNHLVGQEFFVGPVRLRGMRLCEPCMHLEGLTTSGIMAALVHRGGLRADVLTDGTIRGGDPVRPAG